MLAQEKLDRLGGNEETSAQHSQGRDRHRECGSHSGLRWYCAQVHVGRHFEARDRLIQQGFEAFLPIGSRIAPGGELRIAPLFGPYLLVRFDLSKPGWRKVCHTRGIRRVFGGSPESPTALPDAVAERILGLTLTAGEERGPPVRGEALACVAGPYRGTSGLCLDLYAGTVRAWMFLSTGPADLEMPARWCRRA